MRPLIASAIGVAFAGCSFSGAPPAIEAERDAGDRDVSAAIDAARPFGAWSKPVRLGELEVFGEEGNYDDPTMTDAGELYFAISNATTAASIYRSTRGEDGTFSAPVRDEQLSTQDNETTLWVSANGLRIYLGHRPSGGSTDIYESKRAGLSEPWAAPSRLADGVGSSVNSVAVDALGQVSADGLRIYFASNREDPDDYDLYRASRASEGGAFDNVEKLSVSRVGIAEFSPKLSADELTLYFAARGADADASEMQIFAAERDSIAQDFSSATELVDISDKLEMDNDFTVTSNDREAFFTSTRDDAAGIRERIYHVERE